MTTKNARAERNPAPEAAQPSQPEPTPNVAAVAEPAQPLTQPSQLEAAHHPEETATYITNEWHGLPHYECTLCPYDTLDEGEMLLRKKVCDRCGTAPPAPQAAPMRSLVLDRFGNPIATQEG